MDVCFFLCLYVIDECSLCDISVFFLFLFFFIRHKHSLPGKLNMGTVFLTAVSGYWYLIRIVTHI